MNASLLNAFRWCIIPALVAVMVSMGCSSEETGAFKDKPFPKESADQTLENGVQIRLTKSGLDFIENSVPDLLKQFLPNGLDICVPKTSSGDITACHESQCDNGETGCQLNLEHKNTEISTAPRRNGLTIELAIENINEIIAIDYDSFLGEISCEVDLHKKDSEDDVPATLGGTVPVNFRIDQSTPTNDLEINVKEASLDLDDLGFTINNRGGVGDAVACGVAGISKGVLRGLLEDEIHKVLNDAMQKAAKGQLCRNCNEQDCPDDATCEPLEDSEEGEEDESSEEESEKVKICEYKNRDKCVSRTLGAEGELLIGEFLGGLSVESEIKTNTMVKASDYVNVDTGVDIGSRSALNPKQISNCIPSPKQKRPSFNKIEPSSSILQNQTPGQGNPFMFGVGIHKRALNQGFWGLWASGGLCMKLDHRDTGYLTTDAIGAILSSLPNLAEERSAVKVKFAPQKPPIIDFQNATTSSGEDLFMTLNLEKFDIHMFAFIGGQYVRFLTVRTRLAIPLGLKPAGDNKVQPVFGDLEKAIKKVEPRGAGLLKKSPEGIKEILPSLLNIALPQLAETLSNKIDIPTFFGYKMNLDSSDIRAVDNQFLGIFANLTETSTQQLLASPIPKIDRIDVETKPGRFKPDISVDLSHQFGAPVNQNVQIEYRYRVDGGFWSRYRPIDEDKIKPELFVIPGRHHIEVQSRIKDRPETRSDPVSKTVKVDYRAPKLDLKKHKSVVKFDGTDTVDRDFELKYRYRATSVTGKRLDWSRWNSKSKVKLDKLDIETPFKLDVEVKDSSQQTRRKSIEIGSRNKNSASTRAPARGCSTGTNSSPIPLSLLTILLFAVGFRVRNPYQRIILSAGLLLCLGIGISGCSVNQTQKPLDTNPDASSCSGSNCETKASNPSCGDNEYFCQKTDACKSKPANPCASKECGRGLVAKPVSGGKVNSRECTVSDYVCECSQTPRQSKLGWYGGHADMVSNQSVTAISVYNRTYGDLMVGQYNGSKNKIDWNWVDGLPESASSKFEADKTRGGLEGEGPNVGKHTAIAIDKDKRLHILYRDIDNQALKYSKGTPTGGDYDFKTTTLFKKGETGYFSDISVSDGTIFAVTSTYQIETDSETTWQTRVKYLEFKAGAALSDLSPETKTLYSTTSANPCGGCGDGKACFLEQKSCLEVGSGCGTCRGRNACNEGSCKPIFGRKPVSYKQMAGLHTTFVRNQSAAGLVFYDQTKNRVIGLKKNEDGWSDPKKIAEKTGPFVSADMDSNNTIHLAYMDRNKQKLLYQKGLNAEPESIAGGERNDGSGYLLSSIGESVSLKVESDGSPVAIYQDAVSHSLKQATRSREGGWTTERLESPNPGALYAHGFYASITKNPAQKRLAIELMISNQSDPPTAMPNIIELP